MGATKVEGARQALVARVTELEKDKEDRVLKNFTVEVEVPEEYHSQIIGKKGKVITEIREIQSQHYYAQERKRKFLFDYHQRLRRASRASQGAYFENRARLGYFRQARPAN